MRDVGILILVDQDVAEAPLIVGEYVLARAEDGEVVQQEVAEIGGVHFEQALLIGAVEIGRLAVGEIWPVLGADLVGGQAAILPALDRTQKRACRHHLVVEARGLKDLLGETKLIVGVENGEVLFEPDHLGMAAQDARRDGMERAEPHAFATRADHLLEPLAHFVRGLVGEGDGEHLARKGAAQIEEMREAGGEHPGLAGAGAGQHQNRTLQRLDGLALRLVEGRQILRRGSRWRGRLNRRRRALIARKIEFGH